MTSKANKLGMGASFAQTQTISPRRQAIEAATNAPTEGAPPPLVLPVDLISLNPANPRSELGDLTQLAGSLRDHRQKTAISIMSRFTYLEAHPDKEGELEEGTKYVAIDGNSRLAAAREAGLKTIKVMLDDEMGSSPDEILESALVANIHRQDLDHLDEAKALQQLLTVHGTQEALAARLHRSQGWVSQRLALLGLTQELKEKLVSGEEPAELLRRVGNKKPEEQEPHLERLKQQRQKPPTPRKPSTAQPPAPPEAAPSAPAAGDHYGVMKPEADQTAVSVPVERRSAPAADTGEEPHLPWHNPQALNRLAREHMTVEDRSTLAKLLAQD